MSGNRVFLDTNVILYYLMGDKTLSPIFTDKHLHISFITELELLGYKEISDQDLQNVKTLLSFCVITGVSETIKEKTITLRRTTSLKLPDALILASSLDLSIPLITADKSISAAGKENVILYKK